MFRSIVVFLFACHLQLLTCVTSCAAQPVELSAKLSAPVHDYSLTANNFLEGLIRVANDFRIPIGIEWVNTPTARKRLALHWKDATVAEMLETIARTQTGYKLEVERGVVHICPTEIPRDQDFLNLQVKSFVVHNEVVQMAERRLRAQVKLTTSPTEVVPRSGIGNSLAVGVNEPTISLEAKEGSVQDILDLLVTVSTKKIWVVTYVNNPVPTAAGFRRTVTLWNKFPVPDDEQPVWNLFAWGEPIPLAGLEVQ